MYMMYYFRYIPGETTQKLKSWPKVAAIKTKVEILAIVSMQDTKVSMQVSKVSMQVSRVSMQT